MTVRKYGTTLQIDSRGEFRESSLYVSDGASDTFGGGGAGTTFKGNGGNDTIFGRGGEDVLLGGAGNDILVGGTQADAFIFNTALGSRNVDKIADFSRYQQDKIVLENSIFVGLNFVPLDGFDVGFRLTGATGDVGRMQQQVFQVGTAALDADDRVIYDRASGSLSFDPDGTGVAAATKFAQVKAGLLLTYNDFLVS